MTAITGVHPYADKFPMLPDDELAELAESISEHGLRNPIIVTPDGLIIDGRNRWAACQRIGLEPEAAEYDGSDIAEFVIDANTTRRHMTTGQRAMASALVLAEDGRRGNGRWKRGSVDIGESPNISTWQDALKRSGVVLDFRPELAGQVVAGDLTLNAAFEQADAIRRSAEAEKLRAKAEEKRRRDEAKAAKEREDKIVGDLAELSPRHLQLVESGTLKPAEAWAAYMADTERERRAKREEDEAIRGSLRHIQEAIRMFDGGRERAALWIRDTLPHQARLSPEGMHVTRERVCAAIAYLDELKEAL